MKVINFAETNSVLNQYVAEIRDVAVQGDRMRFRRNIERIGEIMAYEMSKELTYSVKQVQTPLGVASVSTPGDCHCFPCWAALAYWVFEYVRPCRECFCFRLPLL